MNIVWDLNCLLCINNPARLNKQVKKWKQFAETHFDRTVFVHQCLDHLQSLIPVS